MGWKLFYLLVFFIPVLASCSSTTGIANKDSLSCDPRQVAQAAKPRLASFCEVSPPSFSSDLCSVTTDRKSAACSRDEKVWLPRAMQTVCKKNPAVPHLCFPVPGGCLSSGFGYRHGSFHSGLDISAAKGDPIIACADGTVVFTGSRKGFRSYGQTVLIDHGNDVFTHYAHASRLLVKAGQKVRRGDKIALVGSTGRSTSPHLHLEVRVGSQLFNPYAYFAPRELRGVQVARGFSGVPLGPVGSRRRVGPFTVSRSVDR
jgi:hypothetical protein